MCRAGAAPVGQDTGLAEIRAPRRGVGGRPACPPPTPPPAPSPSATSSATTPPTCAPWSTSPRIRPLKVVVDAGNGMGGHTVPTVLAGLPVDLVPMYFELDGTFPNHEANPLDPKNIVDLQARVRENGADIGLAFDGDADRCFVVDERGEPVSPSAVTALVASRELAKQRRRRHDHPQPDHLLVGPRGRQGERRHPGAHPRRPLLHQGGDGQHRRRSSAASTPRTTTSATSGTPTPACSPPSTSSPPSASQDGPLSALVAAYDRYAASGEINSTVDDQAGRAPPRSGPPTTGRDGVASTNSTA